MSIIISEVVPGGDKARKSVSTLKINVPTAYGGQVVTLEAASTIVRVHVPLPDGFPLNSIHFDICPDMVDELCLKLQEAKAFVLTHWPIEKE